MSRSGAFFRFRLYGFTPSQALALAVAGYDVLFVVPVLEVAA